MDVPEVPQRFQHEGPVPTAFANHTAYFGFVPLELLPRRLAKEGAPTGRFLLRCVSCRNKVIMVVTIYGSHCEAHYRIGLYTGESGDSVFALEGQGRGFKSVEQLLKYYTTIFPMSAKNNYQPPNSLTCGFSLRYPMDRLSTYVMAKQVREQGVLGEGNFCQVKRVEYVVEGREPRPAAMKVCHLSEEGFVSRSQQAAVAEMFQEAKVLAGFKDYTFITMIYGICYDEPIPKLLMELCTYGSVESLLTTSCSVSVTEKVMFAYDIAAGMTHLEACYCVHRDLASRNCLISAAGVVKVADFGLARGLRELNNERFREFKAPVRWMSPECLVRNPRFSNKSDVWAYGMTLYEIFTNGLRPFYDEEDMKTLARRIRAKELPTVSPEVLAQMPEEMASIMYKCWSYLAAERLPFYVLKERVATIALQFEPLQPKDRCFKPNKTDLPNFRRRNHAELEDEETPEFIKPFFVHTSTSTSSQPPSVYKDTADTQMTEMKSNVAEEPTDAALDASEKVSTPDNHKAEPHRHRERHKRRRKLDRSEREENEKSTPRVVTYRDSEREREGSHHHKKSKAHRKGRHSPPRKNSRRHRRKDKKHATHRTETEGTRVDKKTTTTGATTLTAAPTTTTRTEQTELNTFQDLPKAPRTPTQHTKESKASSMDSSARSPAKAISKPRFTPSAPPKITTPPSGSKENKSKAQRRYRTRTPSSGRSTHTTVNNTNTTFTTTTEYSQMPSHRRNQSPSQYRDLTDTGNTMASARREPSTKGSQRKEVKVTSRNDHYPSRYSKDDSSGSTRKPKSQYRKVGGDSSSRRTTTKSRLH